MQHRRLGYTDLNLSTIGLGTWAHGGSGWRFSWGAQEDADSIATIHRALDLGVNWIDTAAVYGLGHAEEVTGMAIRGLSQKPYIATKCSRRWDADGNIFSSLKRDSVRREVEDSLRRLQVEVIDLYQVHWPMPEEDIEEGWSAVSELIRAGKVRYAGVSNFQLNHLQRIQSIHPPASLQPPYSMLVRNVETELLPYCASHQIGVIGYSPLQKGLLTGKITPEWVANLPPDDHRTQDQRFQEPQLSANVRLMAGLRPIAEKNGLTLAQLAIAWVLRRPELTAAIVGGRKPEQVEETIAAGDAVLDQADLDQIEALLAAL